MSKITLKLVRSFSIGFTIFSYKQNKCFCCEIMIGCLLLNYWPKGKEGLVSFESHWNSYQINDNQ